MGSQGHKSKKLPVWVAIVIGTVAIVLALVAAGLLLWFEVFKPARSERRSKPDAAEATPENVSTPTEDPGITAIATPAAEEPTEKPAEEPKETPALIPTENPETPAETPAEGPTPEPIIVSTQEPTVVPTEIPTPEPTAIPTPEPTEEPTPAPTKKPDSFTFGGKTIKAGTKKIDGAKLGISGKSGSLRHITEEEVENLVELCPALEELSLDYCYMDDYEPLGALVKLKTLRLRRCNENGKGNPVEDIGWVANLTSLTTLQRGHNAISDLTPLAKLKKLTKLNLSYNDLRDDDLDALSDLTELQELSLYGLDKITDVAPLASLTKLTYLHLGYNKKLKNIKALTSLPKLSSLRVNKTNISDVSYFKNFKALKKLDISGCPILFHDYYALEDCAKLELIVLDSKDHDASLAIDDMINNGFGVEILYEWP